MLIGNLKIRDRRLMIPGKTTILAIRLCFGGQTEYHHYRRTLFSRFLTGDNTKSHCLQLSQFLRPIWMNSRSSVFFYLPWEKRIRHFFFVCQNQILRFFEMQKTYDAGIKLLKAVKSHDFLAIVKNIYVRCRPIWSKLFQNEK